MSHDYFDVSTYEFEFFTEILIRNKTTLPLLSSVYKYAIIAIIAIIAVIVVAAFVTNAGNNTTTKESITVKGTVTTTGIGTTPNHVTFESGEGQENTATVNAFGSYSIDLEAPDSYDIEVSYTASNVVTNTCDGGTLNLDTKTNPKTFDIRC